MIFGFDPIQFVADQLARAFANLGPALSFLLNLVGTTPIGLTTGNPFVQQSWMTMTIVADSLLGLFFVIGIIQSMIGETTGTLTMPIGQFVGKAILTAILIHLSAFFGQALLQINNALCGLVEINLIQFVQTYNKGVLLQNKEQVLLAIALTVTFGIALVRIIFQAVTRLARFNLLFVLSGPAFLSSLHPASASVFSLWARLFVFTVFEQFFQVLTFYLGLQFLVSTRQTGFTGFVIATAMLNLTASVPTLLVRFSAASGGNQGGVGALVSTAVRIGLLLAR